MMALHHPLMGVRAPKRASSGKAGIGASLPAPLAQALVTAADRRDFRLLLVAVPGLFVAAAAFALIVAGALAGQPA